LIKNVTVLGAGTAGMLSALWAQKFLVDSNVTVIENSKKGIIGVGEATIPSFPGFLRMIDIDPLHMLKSVKGTIKNGISFENWNGDGDRFLHDFSYSGDLGEVISNANILPIFTHDCGVPYYQKQLINKGIKFKDYFYSPRISYENKVDLNNVTYAFHFNTNNVSKYLKEVAESRGIKFVDGNFEGVSQDENGYINQIFLEEETVDTDFVFDCSGMARLILGGVYNEKWVSYKEYLPMKCAIPFFLENEYDIKPYTSAIAMKNGWMWNTPLQDRIGAGYVFDSDYITPEEAQQEVEEFLGKKIAVNKTIHFDAGRYENIWVKNCIGLGLSSNFIEPLESTSIAMTTDTLSYLLNYVNNMNSKEQTSNIKSFNKRMSDEYEAVKEFIYMHYLTKRQDSKFWKEFRDKHPIPKKLSSKLELLSNNDFKTININTKEDGGIWNCESYMAIAEGLGLMGTGSNLGYENISPSLEEMENIFDKFKINNAITHKEALQQL
jgi:tryptophan halogenase